MSIADAVPGSAFLTIDEATVLVALLHHMGSSPESEASVVARRYADMLRWRVEVNRADVARSMAGENDRPSLQRQVAIRRESFARLRAEARALELERRRLRTVMSAVQSLIGAEGDVVLDEDDSRLVELREVLRRGAA